MSIGLEIESFNKENMSFPYRYSLHCLILGWLLNIKFISIGLKGKRKSLISSYQWCHTSKHDIYQRKESIDNFWKKQESIWHCIYVLSISLLKWKKILFDFD